MSFWWKESESTQKATKIQRGSGVGDWGSKKARLKQRNILWRKHLASVFVWVVCPLFENCFAGLGLVASILPFSKWVTITFKSRFLSTHCSPPTGSLHQGFPIISRPLATVTTHCPIAPTCPQSYQQQKIRFLGRAIQNLVHHSFLHGIFHSNIQYTIHRYAVLLSAAASWVDNPNHWINPSLTIAVTWPLVALVRRQWQSWPGLAMHNGVEHSSWVRQRWDANLRKLEAKIDDDL